MPSQQHTIDLRGVYYPKSPERAFEERRDAIVAALSSDPWVTQTRLANEMLDMALTGMAAARGEGSFVTAWDQFAKVGMAHGIHVRVR